MTMQAVEQERISDDGQCVRQGRNCAAQLALPGKCFSMAQAGARLLVATSSRHVLAYDIRRFCQTPHTRPNTEERETHRGIVACHRCWIAACGCVQACISACMSTLGCCQASARV